jgi:ribosomal protein L37AE/L43A
MLVGACRSERSTSTSGVSGAHGKLYSSSIHRHTHAPQLQAEKESDLKECRKESEAIETAVGG